MSESVTKEEVATAGGIAVIATVIALVALVASLRPTSTVTEGITGIDLQRAVHECIPTRSTFEQELACFQAVYGNNATAARPAN